MWVFGIMIVIALIMCVLVITIVIQENFNTSTVNMNDDVLIRSDKVYATVRKILDNQAVVETFGGEVRLVSISGIQKTTDLDDLSL